MEMEDILEGIVWALPFLAIAGIYYVIAIWKKTKGKGLHARARELLDSGSYKEARDVLLQSLWKANETPQLERQILNDLSRVYENLGIAFESSNYKELIRQFEMMSSKHSQKAISEMKKIQALKKDLIDRMPRIN